MDPYLCATFPLVLICLERFLSFIVGTLKWKFKAIFIGIQILFWKLNIISSLPLKPICANWKLYLCRANEVKNCFIQSCWKTGTPKEEWGILWDHTNGELLLEGLPRILPVARAKSKAGSFLFSLVASGFVLSNTPVPVPQERMPGFIYSHKWKNMIFTLIVVSPEVPVCQWVFILAASIACLATFKLQN